MLSEVYERIVIPQAVLDELQRNETQAAVRQWIANRSDWIEVQQASMAHDAALEELGARRARGAIALAELLKASTGLLGERIARQEASRLELVCDRNIRPLRQGSRSVAGSI